MMEACTDVDHSPNDYQAMLRTVNELSEFYSH